MNMANATCGPTDETNWDKIDWSKLNSNVKRLQTYVVKAMHPRQIGNCMTGSQKGPS